MKRSLRRLEPRALELIEEAVHLLRGASAGTLAIYYLGAVPFVLGVLFFWAHTTWFQPTGEQVAWAALGLVAGFAMLKVAQVEFCARLMAARLGAAAPTWSWARARRLAAAQMRLQPWLVTGLALGAALNLLRLLLYVFIAAAVVLILGVVWLVARGVRRPARPVLAAQAVTAAAPDLRDEHVQAAQLPLDGWLALAREQMARGEWRLALRALYLATLARLAADGLVSLAKFKTNLDYEREVRRRALSRTDIAARFAVRRREFEDAWYGRAQPGEAQVRAWMTDLERGVSP